MVSFLSRLSTRGAQNVYPESSFTKDVRGNDKLLYWCVTCKKFRCFIHPSHSFASSTATRDVVKGDTVLFTQTIYE